MLRYIFLLLWVFGTCCSQEQSILNALFEGDFESAKELLLSGNDPNELEHENGWTPLQVVAYNGSLELTQLLVTYGARVNDACREGWTPLIIACREGRLDIVKYLIENDADIFVVSRTALSAFSASVLSGNHELQAYLRRVIEVSELGDLYVNTNGRLSELLSAAHSGDPYAVKAVLEDGANPNQRSIRNNMTPLMLAVIVSSVESIEILLQAGADTDLKDEGGWTALMYAVQYVSSCALLNQSLAVSLMGASACRIASCVFNSSWTTTPPHT